MCSTSSFKSTWLIYAAITAVQAQNANFQHEVTADLGTDVILPCHGPNQWFLNTPEGEMKSILNNNFEVSSSERSLMDRVEITHEYLKIKNVTLADTGLYTCYGFPFFWKTTKLFVQEVTHSITPRMISTGVFVLVIVIMAAMTYLIIYKIRRKAPDKSHASTGADSAMIDTCQL